MKFMKISLLICLVSFISSISHRRVGSNLMKQENVNNTSSIDTNTNNNSTAENQNQTSADSSSKSVAKTVKYFDYYNIYTCWPFYCWDKDFYYSYPYYYGYWYYDTWGYYGWDNYYSYPYDVYYQPDSFLSGYSYDYGHSIDEVYGGYISSYRKTDVNNKTPLSHLEKLQALRKLPKDHRRAGALKELEKLKFEVFGDKKYDTTQFRKEHSKETFNTSWILRQYQITKLAKLQKQLEKLESLKN